MKTFLLNLLLFLSLCPFAQLKRIPIDYQVSGSFSPLALLDVDNNVMLSGEYRLSKHTSLVGDLGYIFASTFMGNARGVSGFNLRPGFRYYFGRRNNNYVQPQAFYKQVTYRVHDWIGKECVNGTPSYQQLTDFRYRKQVAGLNLIYGLLLPISKKVFVDLYTGVGARYKMLGMADEKEGCYDLGTDFLGDLIYRDNAFSISVPFGVKVTVALKQ